MAYIYKIINQINNKIYIGQTTMSISERWKYHIRDNRKESYNKQPLYLAFHKYGIDNFTIELIEECSEAILNEREIYWISFLNTYYNGYNATLGGNGRRKVDYDLILKEYKKLKSVRKVASKMGHTQETISRAIKEKTGKTPQEFLNEGRKEKVAHTTAIPISQYSLQGEFLRSFNSAIEASQRLKDNNFLTGSIKGTNSHIRDVCKGKRKTAYGFIWKDLT